MTLVSDSEMAALRAVALSGMVTTIHIYHATNVRTEDGNEAGYPSTPSLTVLGWLTEQTPDSATMGVYDGGQSVPEQHRLILPVGTVIGLNDKVVVGNGTYYVQHTSSDNTYKPLLNVTLRTLT
jgi:hypothetical protein